MTIILKMTFSLGLVIVLLFTSNVSNFIKTILNSDYRYFILSVTVSFGSMFLATRRWQILLGRFNSNIDYFSLFHLIGLSNFYNFFIPGGVAGDLIRGIQCRKHKLSGTQGVASVVVDRIIGLGSFILVGIVGCFFSPDALIAPFPGNWIWAVLASSIICACACFNRKLMRNFKIISRISPSVFEKLKLFYDSVYEYKNHGPIACRALAVSLLTALANIVSFYLLSRAAGSDVELMYFLLYVPVITVVSYVPISYSGLGVRELCFVFFFGKVGMTTGQALAVPIMYFGMILILSLAGGLMFLISQHTRTLCGVSSD
jgi:uncharacterized protein (TIRG00374 family)